MVILDNGRSSMPRQPASRRCCAASAVAPALNHCPVYHAVGGHAYGWVYPGPMGAVLTPSLIGVDKGGTPCRTPRLSAGACESVCPVRIPLPKMMRHWREREFERPSLAGDGSGRPELLGLFRQTSFAVPFHHPPRHGHARLAGTDQGPAQGPFLASCPLQAAGRNIAIFPAPQGETFQQLWQKGTACAQTDAFRQGSGVMAAREEIFPANIFAARSACAVTSAPGAAPWKRRLAHTPKGLVPERGQVSGEARIALFTEQAESVQASRCTPSPIARRFPRQSPRICANTICRRNWRMGADPRLAGMPWGETSLSAETRRQRRLGSQRGQPRLWRRGRDWYAGNGLGRGDNPSTLNLSARTITSSWSIAAEIEGDYETMWGKAAHDLRQGRDAAHSELHHPVRLARAISSRHILLGAHGPRRVHIVVVGESSKTTGGGLTGP